MVMAWLLVCCASLKASSPVPGSASLCFPFLVCDAWCGADIMGPRCGVVRSATFAMGCVFSWIVWVLCGSQFGCRLGGL